MKKWCLLFAALVLMPNLAYGSIGFTTIVDASEAARPLVLSIWYPSDGDQLDIIGGNAVFRGEYAALEAPVVGKHPLIVLSHGGLRSAKDSGAWLGAALAKAGFMVIEVNAPRPETPATAVNEIWQRPRDISRALSVILDNALWADHVDEKKIAVVGFALGGTAALAVAGAELDPKSYYQSCTDAGSIGADCTWFSSHNVALNQVDQDEFEQSRHDYRFTSAVLIAPEYLDAFSSDGRMALAPTLLISLGSQEMKTSRLPHVEKKAINEASLLDVFAVCTESGPQILLEEEGDAALCGTSPEERNRIHALIADMIISFLGS